MMPLSSFFKVSQINDRKTEVMVLLACIAAIICISEVALGFLSLRGGVSEAGAAMIMRNALWTTAVATPLIYFLVVSPFTDKAHQAEGTLQRALSAADSQTEHLAEILARLDLQKQVLDLHACVSETDAVGRITYVNDALCKTSGYARNELIGTSHSLINSEFHPQSFWQEMHAAVKAGHVWQREVCNRKKDGSLFWLTETVAGNRNEEGQLIGYICVGANITENKRLQEEMIRRGKLAQLGQLTATVAHEIRNPLGAVKTAAFVLERKIKGAGAAVGAARQYAATLVREREETAGSADQEASSDAANRSALVEACDAIARMLEVESQIQRINTGISRCDKIITELLDFTRSRSLNICMAPVDDWVGSVIDEEIETLPSAVKVKRAFGLGNVQAGFDADQMRRVLINLISNASEAMVGKGKDVPIHIVADPTITVATRLVDGNVEVIVSDNGPGISVENLSRIREPLFTTKSFGVGLGIPAIEKILALHGGGLKIESEAGHGAQMTAWFPVSQVQERAA